MLSQVHASTDQEIREMHDEQANPQNAVVREHGRGAAGYGGVEGGIPGRPGDRGFLDGPLFLCKWKYNKGKNKSILLKSHAEKWNKL